MADLSKDTVEIKSPIIMKVDAPPEDNNSASITSPQGVTENNVNENDLSSSHTETKPKRSVLASPRLNNSNPFGMRNNSNINNSSSSSSSSSNSSNVKSVLRPSQLSTKLDTNNTPATTTTNLFALNPSRLNSTLSTSSTNYTNNGIDTPKFVPLVVTTDATQTTNVPAAAKSSTFVFGQNLHARVISESETKSESTNNDVNNVDDDDGGGGGSGDDDNEAMITSQPSTSCSPNANGTSSSELLLFSSEAAKQTIGGSNNKEVKSLSESAREYEESRANKRKYDEVVIVTGEEDEMNVLQINCKLFAFDKASGNWQERGRGTLRLNDKEMFNENFVQSRLVIRTTGSLRVVLNTKIWAEMTVDRASQKSLRLTAMDSSGVIKVFLIMASLDEINQLHRLLKARVNNEIARQKQLKNGEPDIKKQAIDNEEETNK